MESIVSCFSSFYNENIKPHTDSLVKPLLDKYGKDQLTTICTTTVVGSVVLLALLGSISSKKSRKSKNQKRKKRGSKNKGGMKEITKKKPLTLEEKIESVQQKYNKEYKDGLHSLLANFKSDSETDEYQCNYYNEMLLKLLIELDGVDLTDVEGERKQTLKEKRKAAVKEIQGELKNLDRLRK